MDINKFLPSRSMRILVYSLCGLLVALLIFKAGTLVQYRHGYLRHGPAFHPPFGPRQFLHPPAYFGGEHGTTGTVSNVSGNTLTLTDRNGNTRTIHIATTTQIRDVNGISLSTLQKGARIVLLGTPHGDEINAEFIRILPSLATSTLQ